MTESLTRLVDMHQEREQHAGVAKEHMHAILEIDKRFNSNRDLLMIDIGPQEMSVREKTYFYHTHEDGRYVLQADPDQISLWDVTHQTYSDFHKYLSQLPKEVKGQIALYYGVAVGYATGFGASLHYSDDWSIGIGILVSLAALFIGAYTGNEIDNAIWNKVKERRRRNKPVAEGVEALEKFVELYPKKT